MLRFGIPAEYLARLQYEERVADVVEYWYGVQPEEGLHSLWLFRFFGRTAFIAVISENEDGTFPWEQDAAEMGHR